MNIQALKHIRSLALAVALLVMPHAADAVDPPTIGFSVYNNVDAILYVDLWLKGRESGMARLPLVQRLPVAAGGTLRRSDLSCGPTSDCGEAVIQIRDGHGNPVCKAWMQPSGGDVVFRLGMLRQTGGATGYAICGLGGWGVDYVEVHSGPYRQ